MRKWGGKPHYRFEVDLLGRDDHGTWLAGRPPVPFEGPEYPGEFLQRFAILVPDDRWWVASFNEEGPHTDIEVYVDITTPAEWTSESHVTIVDIDLDIVLQRDGRLYIDDEDEFEDHIVEYAYPADLVDNARRTATEMLDVVRARGEPFGDVFRRWLDKV
jgi:predicted RNA-binding protein associated with RNAse of E/G family